MNALNAFQLDGQIAVVTGGGSGLGAESARALAAAGCHVVVAARRLSRLDNIVAEIKERGLSAESVELDVVDSTAVTQVFGDVASRHGRLDILVNNAGVASQASVADVTVADWTSVLDINLRGTFTCAQAFAALPGPASRSIVNIASLAGLVGVKGQSAYVASKTGVIGLTRALALELAADDIRVNAVAPGYFRTDMPAEVLAEPAAHRALVRKIPMRRVGSPEEIGPAVLFLASPASSYVTGAVLSIDGGYTAQ